jgi:hypothetical protein
MKTGKQAWYRAWNEMPQAYIQGWIKRLVRRIQEVIRLDGGNGYREGRHDKASRNFKGLELRGQLSI